MTESVADPNFCTVETTSGIVRGLVSSAIRQFKGLPYAASTAGANRFKRPQLAKPGTGPSEERAVLFSIHGCGFAMGSGNNSLYDGARLAGFGDVVVVTVTHRLASFGYLNLADIDPAGEWRA